MRCFTPRWSCSIRLFRYFDERALLPFDGLTKERLGGCDIALGAQSEVSGASGLKLAWRSKECLIVPDICTRAIFAGIMGFLLFAELPDRYTLVGAVIIVGSTLYIAYRETQLSRMHRAAVAARPTDPDRAPRNAEGRIWVYVAVPAGKQPGVGPPLPSSEFPLLESYIDVAVEGVWNMAPNTRARSSRQRRTGVAIGSMIESSRVVRGSLTSSTMRSTSCSPLRRTSPIGCSPSNMP
jgi:hypothetical protein